MNYATKTKSNLIDILGYRDNEIKEFQSLYANNDIKVYEFQQLQLFLFWLLFIVAGIGFSF